MNERKQLFYLISALSAVALAASALAIYLLYSTAIRSAHDQLAATAKSQARLIESMARHDVTRHRAPVGPPEIPAGVLDEILDSFRRYEGFGATGEFLLGRRDGDSMVYLARQRSDDLPAHGVSEPMRRALSGQSGVILARDYRGEEVLAAYEAVRGLNVGVVAKMDLAEIRAPFIRAGAMAGALAIFVVLLCAALVLRFTHPIIRRLQASEAHTRAIVDTAGDAIVTIDEKGIIESFNPGAERLFGYTREEAVGSNVSLLMPEPYRCEHDTYIQNYLHTGKPRIIGIGRQIIARRKDGSVFHVELSVNEMRLDGRRKFVGIIHDTTERVLAEQALRQSEERLRVLYDASPVVLSVSRLEDGRFLDVNPAFLRTGGWTREEVVGRTSFDLGVWVDPGDRERIVQAVRETGAVRDLELSFRMKSGELRRLLCSIERVRIDQEDCLLLLGQDITERKKAEIKMRKLSRAIEQAADSVMITDREGVIEYVNPAFEKTTGYASTEALGKKPSLVKSGKQSVGFYRNLWDTILGGEVFSEVFVNRRKDGSFYFEEKTITPLKDTDGRITHFIATGRDITERMQTQERLAHMAQHDPLTELPNRALLLDRLKQALAGARWHGRRVAVLFVDLDRFKTINDTLGHEAGDRLLQQLAERFGRSVREGDTVARFGGDEFVILLDDVAAEDDIVGVAQKVLAALTPPFEIDGQVLYITASIGVSLFPNDGEDSATLLKNADIAMYRAKERGKNTYQFYSADMSVRAFER